MATMICDDGGASVGGVRCGRWGGVVLVVVQVLVLAAAEAAVVMVGLAGGVRDMEQCGVWAGRRWDWLWRWRRGASVVWWRRSATMVGAHARSRLDLIG